MSITRRGFFGSLLGLLGLGGVAKAKQEENVAYKRLLQSMKEMAPGGWSADYWELSKQPIDRNSSLWKSARERAVTTWEKRGPRLEKPNPQETLDDLFDSLADQMYLTGVGLVWTVPNKLGEVYEAFLLPTAQAIPCPAIPGYPDGYYRIQPIYPYGPPFSNYPTPSASIGVAIPAQWVFRCKIPHPLVKTTLRLHIDEMEAMDKSRWFGIVRPLNVSK